MSGFDPRFCPRCGDPFDGAQRGHSRATEGRDVEVCGPCCTDEGWHDSRGIPLPSVSEWPVPRTFDALGRFIVL